MKKTEKYKISEFANMVGLPQSKIRYYEKLGLFREKRTENGYRYYVPEDAFRVNAFRMLLTYGFSVEQSIELLDQQQSGSAFRQTLLWKKQELEEEAKLLEIRAQRIEGTLAAMERQVDSHFSVEDVEDIIYVRASFGRDFHISSHHADMVARFVQNVAYTSYSRIIRMDDLLGEGETVDPSYISSLPVSQASLLGEIDPEGVGYMTFGKCLVGYRKCTREDSVKKENFLPFLDYIKDHGYQVRNDMLIVPTFLNLDGNGLDVEKLIIPVC